MVNAEHEVQVAKRLQEVTQLNQARKNRLQSEAQNKGSSGAVQPNFVCHTLNGMIDSDDVVLNEAIRHSLAVMNHLPRNQPKTLFGAAGGGLGYSGGMSLGIRLANPKKRVVQIVGDGGFHFSTPTSVYSVAQAEGLPIFTVVLDNGGWQAVKEATLRVHPDGYAAKEQNFHAKHHGEKRQFEQVGAAFGAIELGDLFRRALLLDQLECTAGNALFQVTARSRGGRRAGRGGGEKGHGRWSEPAKRTVRRRFGHRCHWGRPIPDGLVDLLGGRVRQRFAERLHFTLLLLTLPAAVANFAAQAVDNRAELVLARVQPGRFGVELVVDVAHGACLVGGILLQQPGTEDDPRERRPEGRQGRARC